MLLFAGGSQTATLTLHQDQQTVQVPLETRLKANNVFAIRDAAIAGLGGAQLPQIVAAAACQDGLLQPLLPRWSLPTIPVHAVFASARYLTPKVRSFIDLAVGEMNSLVS